MLDYEIKVSAAKAKMDQELKDLEDQLMLLETQEEVLRQVCSANDVYDLDGDFFRKVETLLNYVPAY